MKELLDDLERWRGAGRRVALARVVDVEGSGPRAPGAAMAVAEDGEVAGSVSGGCVEGAVVSEALDRLASGGPGRLVSFGYSDDDAFAVGLTCGGTVHLFVEAADPFFVALAVPGTANATKNLFDRLAAALRDERPVSLVTLVAGTGVGAKLLVEPERAPAGSLGDPGLDRVVARDALAELDAGRSGVRHYGLHGEARQDDVAAFIESFSAPPRMLVFGAEKLSMNAATSSWRASPWSP